jgi:adenylate kinase family enzyme
MPRHTIKELSARSSESLFGKGNTSPTAKCLSYGYQIEKVFYLDLPEDESYRRLIKRGRPLHEGNGELHDSPERINQRLAIYKQGEKDVLEYYRKKGVLHRIDANQSVEDVHKSIMAHFQQNPQA